MKFRTLKFPVPAVNIFFVLPNGSPGAAHQMIRISTSHARRSRNVVINTPEALKTSKYENKVEENQKLPQQLRQCINFANWLHIERRWHQESILILHF